MITTILSTIGALATGIIIGRYLGKKLFRTGIFAPDNNVAGIRLREFSVEPLRLQIAREVDIPPLAPPDLKCALLRETEKAIQKSTLEEMKRRGLLSPREVYHAYGNSGFERYRLELSLLVAKYPTPDELSAEHSKPQISHVKTPLNDCKLGV